MSPLVGFDLEEYFKNTEHNLRGGQKLLAPYLGHFQVVASAYTDLLSSILVADVEGDFSQIVRFHYLSGTTVNLVKSTTSVMAGHFTDANVFHRRTLESIRYSIFLRENPAEAATWTKTREPHQRKAMESKFKTWLNYKGGGGKKLVDEELPDLWRFWDKVNNVGPHANVSLLSFQSDVIVEEDGQHRFKIKYHEIEPGEKGTALLIQYFLINLTIHFLALNWWIRFSGLEFRITIPQKQFWEDNWAEFKKAIAAAEPYLSEHLSFKPFTNPPSHQSP